MKVLHVVTLVSPDGAYGGPVTVATAQAEELARRGHQVRVVAARAVGGSLRGSGYSADLVDVAFRLPVGEHSGLVAPGLHARVLDLARSADVVHVHLGRDLVTVPSALAALRRRTPLVVQTHGMIKPDSRAIAVVADAVAVRPVLRRARERLVLTDVDAANVRRVAGKDLRTRTIPNGVGEQSRRASWVPESEQELVFCSRLHPRKRPEEFVRLARVLRDRGYRGRFTVLGPDGGSLAAVEALVREEGVDALRVAGPVPPHAVPERLSRAQAFVLPSRDEPYPMAVLEAMALGLPSVISDTTGVSKLFAESGAALVTDGSARRMADALLPVLRDRAAWDDLSDRARQQVRRTNGMARVGDVLEETYDMVTSPRGRSRVTHERRST